MLNIDKTFFLRHIVKLKYRPDSSGQNGIDFSYTVFSQKMNF